MATFNQTIPRLLTAFALWLVTGCSAGSVASPAAPVTSTPVVDVCVAGPLRPECTGRQPAPAAIPGVPEAVQTFADPLGRFAFDFPAGWHTLPKPSEGDGVLMMDAPWREEATQWIDLWVGMNPERASLPVWIAERGMPWPGEVVFQEEGWINGVPAVRQRLEGDDPNMGGHYVYALVWLPAGTDILLWTAWPGDRPETLNVLERMVSGVRSHE